MKNRLAKAILNSVLAIAFLVLIPVTAKAGIFGISQKLVDEPVASSSNFLTNSEGYNYGGEFYLYNNTDDTYRVHYRLEGGYNVFVQSEGGIVDVAPHTRIWIITVTAASTEGWSSGDLRYTYERLD
jgi:hypothetical protein